MHNSFTDCGKKWEQAAAKLNNAILSFQLVHRT